MTAAAQLEIDFEKGAGLVPAIVQDDLDGRVLMLGYMDPAAVEATLSTRLATFYSRSRHRQWTKGETSGHRIHVASLSADCDHDTLLLLGHPLGPVCHTGQARCFQDGTEPAAAGIAYLAALESVIGARLRERPAGSYTTALAAAGPGRAAQKVGEEGVEVALAGVAGSDRELIGESADLLYHLLVLLKIRGLTLRDVAAELKARHAARTSPKDGADDYT